MIIYLLPPVFDSRHASIGAVFVGHMDKLPRGPAMQVLWEVTWLSFGVLVFSTTFKCCKLLKPKVELQTGAASPKILGIKPKMYLTGSVQIPPNTWLKM